MKGERRTLSRSRAVAHKLQTNLQSLAELLRAATGIAEVSRHPAGSRCSSLVPQTPDKLPTVGEREEVCPTGQLFSVSFKAPVTKTTGKIFPMHSALWHFQLHWKKG